MEIILNMMKPFMKKELLQMMHLHPNVDSVNEFVPLEYLPKEFGGTGGPVKEYHNEQIKVLEDDCDWFLSDELNARVDGRQTFWKRQKCFRFVWYRRQLQKARYRLGRRSIVYCEIV